MLALTDPAKSVIRRLIDNADEGVTGLRIMIQEGGCAGLQYFLGLEKDPKSDDEVYDFDGVRIFVDPMSLHIVEGLRIDYLESIEATGFIFDNPNASGVCSCGKSFAS